MWQYNYVQYGDVLCHHGIKGQKWGVRRYQNEDGTLTALGKKRLSKNGDITFEKGLVLRRTSFKKESDAEAGKKLYSTPDEEEGEVYKTAIGGHNIIQNGKAFVHKYVTTNNITLPSIKKQVKIEKSLIKDEEIRKELIESLIKKGYTREDAANLVKPINAGMEFLKVSPLLLAAPINAIAAAINPAAAGLLPVTTLASTSGLVSFASEISAKKREQLRAIENSIGDIENKKTNKAFEDSLKKSGYNAYRDTNDRRSIETKTPIVIIDSDKNVKLTDSHKMTKEEYAKAYAVTKKFYNTKMSSDITFESLVKDGEKAYDNHVNQHILDKAEKEKQDKLLKAGKKKLDKE